MGEKHFQKVVDDAPSAPVEDVLNEVVDDRCIIPFPDHHIYHSLFPQPPTKYPNPATIKSSRGSIERDAVLARVETVKRISLIKAWEESEKTKVENKAHKKLSTIESWESSKKASVEAQLRKMEEKLEKKKAEYAERMKNKVAKIHRGAEEKKAMIEAKRGEDFLIVDETAAKLRATGHAPKKLLGCFSR